MPFYRALLGCRAREVKPGYAKFEPRRPGIVLDADRGRARRRPRRLQPRRDQGRPRPTRCSPTRLRLKQAGLATFDEMDTECCYARQDKIWVHGPGRHAVGGLHRPRGHRARRRRDRAAAGRAACCVMSAAPHSRAPNPAAALRGLGARALGGAGRRPRPRPRATGPRSRTSERDLLHWVLSSLMVAEERISTQFCGLVLAQDDEEEGSFLSTQLVDEARHMQFYARFQNEVIADPGRDRRACRRARARCSATPFRKLFDEALVDAHERLRRDPRNREAKVDFVTIYHLIIEGTLGLTASHFLTDFLQRARAAARLRRRLRTIAADEQRHIGYGIWFLRETVREQPRWATWCARRCATSCPRSRVPAPPAEVRTGTCWASRGRPAQFALDGSPAASRSSACRSKRSMPERPALRRGGRRGMAAFALVFAGAGRSWPQRPQARWLGRRAQHVFGLVIMAMVYASAISRVRTSTRRSPSPSPSRATFPRREAVAYVRRAADRSGAGRSSAAAGGLAEQAGRPRRDRAERRRSARRCVYEMVLTRLPDVRDHGGGHRHARGGRRRRRSRSAGPSGSTLCSAVRVTGASMNPARSFGPALAAGDVGATSGSTCSGRSWAPLWARSPTSSSAAPHAPAIGEAA